MELQGACTEFQVGGRPHTCISCLASSSPLCTTPFIVSSSPGFLQKPIGIVLRKRRCCQRPQARPGQALLDEITLETVLVDQNKITREWKIHDSASQLLTLEAACVPKETDDNASFRVIVNRNFHLIAKRSPRVMLTHPRTHPRTADTPANSSFARIWTQGKNRRSLLHVI